MPHLSDAFIKKLPPPSKSAKIYPDDVVRGLGLRVNPSGAKAFVLRYTIDRRERLLTIGDFPTWSTVAAREEAKDLRRRIDQGHDPLGEREERRDAPTVDELCDRYLAEHAIKKRSRRDDESMLRRIVRPAIGKLKVAAITFSDIDRLHRKATVENGPYQANRLHALLVKMFGLAIRWEMRSDNPARGVERNHEDRRERYLKADELTRLSAALAVYPDQERANQIRLLLLTGSRRGEVLFATWEQLDLTEGIWTKPSSHTKQKTTHRVPLSAAARMLLSEINACQGGPDSGRVFPNATRETLKRPWMAIRKTAGLDGLRLHDLRHSFASILVSGGASLPLIGQLLGHTQAATTHRYAHLLDHPQRAAVERVASVISSNGNGMNESEVVPLRRRP